jgi:uncharacterized protein (TIGR02594 family)
MQVNFNLLNPLVRQQSIQQLPNSGGGGDGISDLLSGLGSLVKGFTKPSTPTQAPPGINQGLMTDYAQRSMGQGPALNPQPRMQQITESQNLFQAANKELGMKEGMPELNAYLSKANPNLDPSVTPWCAGFVGSVLNANGLKGTGSLAAKSYLNYGTPTKQPSQGDIVVFNDMTGRNDPAHGHVGFVQSIDSKRGVVSVIGGNQGNQVSIKEYPLSFVAGFRIPPTGQQVQQFAQQNNIPSPKALSQVTSETHPQLPEVMSGIAHVESGGSNNPYTLLSKPSRNGDRAYGKYQIMGNNIGPWSKEALGRTVTREEFLNNPDLQEKVASYQINKNLKQYGNPDDAFSVWFSGRPVQKAGNARDAYGTTVPQYVKKAREGMMQYTANLKNQPSSVASAPQQYTQPTNQGTLNRLIQPNDFTEILGMRN